MPFTKKNDTINIMKKVIATLLCLFFSPTLYAGMASDSGAKSDSGTRVERNLEIKIPSDTATNLNNVANAFLKEVEDLQNNYCKNAKYTDDCSKFCREEGIVKNCPDGFPTAPATKKLTGSIAETASRDTFNTIKEFYNELRIFQRLREKINTIESQTKTGLMTDIKAGLGTLAKILNEEAGLLSIPDLFKTTETTKQITEKNFDDLNKELNKQKVPNLKQHNTDQRDVKLDVSTIENLSNDQLEALKKKITTETTTAEENIEILKQAQQEAKDKLKAEFDKNLTLLKQAKTEQAKQLQILDEKNNITVQSGNDETENTALLRAFPSDLKKNKEFTQKYNTFDASNITEKTIEDMKKEIEKVKKNTSLLAEKIKSDADKQYQKLLNDLKKEKQKQADIIKKLDETTISISDGNREDENNALNQSLKNHLDEQNYTALQNTVVPKTNDTAKDSKKIEGEIEKVKKANALLQQKLDSKLKECTKELSKYQEPVKRYTSLKQCEDALKKEEDEQKLKEDLLAKLKACSADIENNATGLLLMNLPNRKSLLGDDIPPTYKFMNEATTDEDCVFNDKIPVYKYGETLKVLYLTDMNKQCVKRKKVQILTLDEAKEKLSVCLKNKDLMSEIHSACTENNVAIPYYKNTMRDSIVNRIYKSKNNIINKCKEMKQKEGLIDILKNCGFTDAEARTSNVNTREEAEKKCNDRKIQKAVDKCNSPKMLIDAYNSDLKNYTDENDVEEKCIRAAKKQCNDTNNEYNWADANINNVRKKLTECMNQIESSKKRREQEQLLTLKNKINSYMPTVCETYSKSKREGKDMANAGGLPGINTVKGSSKFDLEIYKQSTEISHSTITELAGYFYEYCKLTNGKIDNIDGNCSYSNGSNMFTIDTILYSESKYKCGNSNRRQTYYKKTNNKYKDGICQSADTIVNGCVK